MRILYAIQGTGNGHLARATEIVPHLQRMAETDILISGIQGDIQVPFPVKYRFYGISFIFGMNGGVDLWKTLIRLRFIRFVKDIFSLPLYEYDLILCDFEPVSAWACKVRFRKCIGISHQNAVIHPKAPKPSGRGRWLGRLILKNYAPVSEKYGFHFKSISENIFTPVIRFSIREVESTSQGHYTVYLPSYSNEEIEKALHTFQEIRWEVFSKHNKAEYVSGNIRFRPVSLDGFTKSFVACKGILCNAGFETPAEAIHLGKKLCVIPMKNQYEQQCNAEFLKDLGITVLSQLNSDNLEKLRNWLNNEEKLQINFPDHTSKILNTIINKEEYSGKENWIKVLPEFKMYYRRMKQYFQYYIGSWMRI